MGSEKDHELGLTIAPTWMAMEGYGSDLDYQPLSILKQHSYSKQSEVKPYPYPQNP